MNIKLYLVMTGAIAQAPGINEKVVPPSGIGVSMTDGILYETLTPSARAIVEEIAGRHITLLNGPFWSEVKKFDPKGYNTNTTGAKRSLLDELGLRRVQYVADQYADRLQDGDWFTLPTFGLDYERLSKENVPQGINPFKYPEVKTENPTLDSLLENLNGKAVAIAQTAIERSGKRLRLVATIAPPGDSYHGDGFPHNNDETPNIEKAVQSYDRQLNALKNYASLFLFETNCKVEQAIAAAIAGEKYGKPYAISFVVDENGFLKGTHGKVTVADAIKIVEKYTKGNLVTYGINCSSHEGTKKALETVKKEGLSDKLKLLYLNASVHDQRVSELSHDGHINLSEWEIANETLSLQREYGIKVVSVCCGGTPLYLSALSQGLQLGTEITTAGRAAISKSDADRRILNAETLGPELNYVLNLE